MEVAKMKREFLEGLGLDKEKIDSIMAEHGKSVETHKSKQTEVSTSLEDLKKQLADRDKDLKDLKKKAEGSEELQTKFTELETKYNQEKADFETKLKDTQLSSALKLALAGKVHDTDLVTGLIDKSKIELGTDGNVTKGLDEQIKELQTSKSFLFVPEKKDKTFRGFVPSGSKGGDDNPIDIGADFAKMANEKGTNSNNENNPWG